MTTPLWVCYFCTVELASRKNALAIEELPSFPSRKALDQHVKEVHLTAVENAKERLWQHHPNGEAALMETRTPAEVFPFAEFLYDELKTRGWTVGDVARKFDNDLPYCWNLIGLWLIFYPWVDNSHSNELAHRQIIHEEVMRGLARAFNVQPEFLRALEKDWRNRPDAGSDFRIDPHDSIIACIIPWGAE